MEQVEFLGNQLTTVESEIKSIMDDIKSPLLTIPGIGINLAASIHAEIGDIKRFKNANQLISYAGIDPVVRQSGNFIGSKSRMSKKGSPYLRLAIWQASITSIRSNPNLKDYYEQKIKQGKHHMTVIGAVANKLTRIIFPMLKDNKEYIA